MAPYISLCRTLHITRTYKIMSRQMAPILYYAPESPPCQLVLLIAKHLNLELELRLLHPRNKNELTPEYLKMNPAHTIPTLDDNGFHLPESRAISIYLLEKYGKDDPLLPKDLKTKALVNHRLFFDLGTLWQRTVEIVRILRFTDEKPSMDKFRHLEEGLEFLNSFLEGHKWLVGDSITIADYVTLITLSSVHVLPIIGVSKYPNVAAWYEMAKSSVEGYDDIVAPQVKIRREFILNKFYHKE